MVYATSGRRERCGQKNAWHSVAERGTRMCVIAAFFARALRVCTGRACMSFFLILQEVRPICKTRNQFVKKRVADRDIRNLIWKFLRAGVMYRGNYSETLTGTPQGGIVSPLLANIYLHELDRYMESKYLNIPRWVRQKRRAQGQANFLYIRYADDCAPGNVHMR